MSGHTSMLRREPVGVCAQVAPWNYPMMMAVWKFAPAVAAGNAVVLKPSDTTPASTTLLAEIAAEFLPPGVLNVICGDRDTGRAMIDHRHAGDGVGDGLGAGGHGSRHQRRQGPQAGSPRARRQGARRRVRRRRPRSGRRGHFASPATSTPDRTAQPPLASSPHRASTATSPTRWPRPAKGTRTGAPDDEDVALRPAQQPEPAGTRRRASSSGRQTTPGS